MSQTATVEVRSPARLAWARFRRSARSRVCLVLLGGIVAACFVLPWVWPQRHTQVDPQRRFEPPSREHLFGRDQLGRDLLFRVLVGGRVSILVGVCATLVSVVVGVAYGAAAGMLGGRPDAVMMRIVDVVYGLPLMFIVVIVMVVLESRSLVLVFMVLGLFTWPTMARIVRGQILSLREKEFVEAARALGVRGPAILARHLLPNTLGPIVVYATLMVPSVMLQEAFLSFLGLGVSAPMTSWGQLLSDGNVALIGPLAQSPWWLLAFPGAALALTLYCLNTVGDALRDAVDVELRE